MLKIIKMIGVPRLFILVIFVIILSIFPELLRWPAAQLGILEDYDSITNLSLQAALKWAAIGLISIALAVVAPWLGVLLGLDNILDSHDGGFFDGDAGGGDA